MLGSDGVLTWVVGELAIDSLYLLMPNILSMWFQLLLELCPVRGLLLRYKRLANILRFLQVLPSVLLPNKYVLD
jgi:hypothetical protein